jgi:hypothetical protein
MPQEFKMEIALLKSLIVNSPAECQPPRTFLPFHDGPLFCNNLMNSGTLVDYLEPLITPINSISRRLPLSDEIYAISTERIKTLHPANDHTPMVAAYSSVE